MIGPFHELTLDGKSALALYLDADGNIADPKDAAIVKVDFGDGSTEWLVPSQEPTK